MPDAFFFGNFVADEAASCNGLQELHNPNFATFMALQARALGNDELMDFANGYGSHIVADVAGFFPGGFLGNGFFPVASSVNWVSVWPYMTAVDAFVLQSKLNLSSSPPQNIPTVSNVTAAFVANMSAVYQTYEPAMPSATQLQVLTCATQWRAVVDVETKKAAALPPVSYEFEIIYNNPLNATTFTQAAQDFSMATSCAVGGISLWRQLVQQSNATVNGVVAAVGNYFVSQFAAGKCAPLGMKKGYSKKFPHLADFQQKNK